MNTFAKTFALAAVAFGMIGTMGINADAARTATATYDCLHRSETDAQHFRHSRMYPYQDRAFCGGQSREDWVETTPWAADHRWQEVTTQSASGLTHKNANPYQDKMVYYHPETSQKVCLTTSQAQQWNLESTDAIRPCESWMW
ncbi:MAG: hypothetical protein KC476_01660 [Cyanobacteria bacterium HKST-UBA06]|nr:hypothetical protein [Cyanobacteria bacterium HKST-UBA04]MCA9806637.1 hypothetical protein [Cyanobacteria bacterium HKST-UBA06]MCA9841549.1 hypothetical protein [Cyanobacteria bacterium HKST-UBA03]